MTEDIQLTADPETGTALVQLNRPAKLNAVRAQSLAELQEVIDTIERDPRCRAVVIAGSGRAFCAGADVAEKKGWDAAAKQSFIEGGRALLAQLRHSRVLFIAALHGFVLGGGLELALSCDIRIAAQNAILGFPEVGLGHLPGWDGPPLLARAVGRQRALHLLVTGTKLSAAEAQAIGLIDDTVADAEVVGAAMARAKLYAAAPEAVVGLVKKAISQQLGSA